MACYERTRDGGWRASQSLQTERLCFEYDSCGGGLGHSGGACVKWAEGPGAPARPWTISRADYNAPPTEHRLYAEHGACPFEGCTLGDWRARDTANLYERADLHSPIVGAVSVGEWVDAAESVSYLAPFRGAVVSAGEDLHEGDVVYLLGGQGEGFYDLWRRGEILQIFEPDKDARIRWDQAPSTWHDVSVAAGAGWWVRVERVNGRGGWLHDPSHFQCMDQLAGDDECASRHQ